MGDHSQAKLTLIAEVTNDHYEHKKKKDSTVHSL